MVAKRQFSCQDYGRFLAFICAVTVVLSGSYLFATEQAGASKLARYRVFSLKHISADQGKKYLAEAGIGTVSQLPSPNTLLVTAQPAELIKASTLLKLVDAKEQFVIKAILPSSEAENLPSKEQIAAEVGQISIGTFSEPPTPTAQNKAIIDIHNNAVTVVTPAKQLEKIISAIEHLQKKTKAQVLRLAESDKSVEPKQIDELKVITIAKAELKRAEAELERMVASDKSAEQTRAEGHESDELFNELLDSLAKAEKMAVEKAQKPPAAPQEPNLPDVVGLEAKDVAEKPKPQPQPEPKPEQVIVTEPAPKVWSYAPEPITNGDEMLELNLPEKLNIIDLLDLVGKYLHLDYMYDEADVKDKAVSLKVQGPIKVKDLYPLLESVLKFKGFVMTRKVNLVTIVPAAKVLEIDPVLHTDADKLKYGDVIITRIFGLKHIDTTNAKNLLDQMQLGVNITLIAETGTLIVTGYAYRMTRIEELLEMIDKPGEAKKFRFRQLQYTMAQTLAPKIKELAEQLGTISITIAAAPPAKPTPTKPPRIRPAPKPALPPAPTAKPTVYLDADERTNRILMIGLVDQLAVVDELIDTLDVKQQDLRTLRLYEILHAGAEEVREKLEELGIISAGRPTPRTRTRAQPTKPTTKKPTTPTTLRAAEEALVEEPQVVIIEATNSLLVNATPEQHTQIAMIIAYADSEPEEAAINYIVYPLENQDPEELAGVLNQLIQETLEEKGKDDKIVRTTTTKKVEEDITIIPDIKTYSLIVYANKKNQQWIKSLIKQLDEYRPQVLLDVTLVEITKNEEFNLDLSLFVKHPTLTEGGSAESPTFSGFLEPFPGKRILEAVSTAGAGVAGFYADEHIQALFDAMHTKGYGRILAKPKLLVNDNEAGNIKTSEEVPIVSVETKVIPGTAAQASTAAPSVKIDTYTAGINLDIEPHISKGDQLRLKIALTRTDFRLNDDYALVTPDGPVTGPTPPDLLTSDVTTVVTVPDNHTIILGGLEKLSQTKGGTKVPLLGDIPLIGGLFRNTANTDDQNRLYVFVKAHILRPGEELPGATDIEVISAKNRATFEKYEKEMQEYEDWPGIKPTPMDPLQILEAE
ncbi:MAG: secretin N-terminal domain-containing protein [Planctomycetota bacterium]|jgi:type II secretory pathway component GspD/PulD (secretin)